MNCNGLNHPHDEHLYCPSCNEPIARLFNNWVITGKVAITSSIHGVCSHCRCVWFWDNETKTVSQQPHHVCVNTGLSPVSSCKHCKTAIGFRRESYYLELPTFLVFGMIEYICLECSNKNRWKSPTDVVKHSMKKISV